MRRINIYSFLFVNLWFASLGVAQNSAPNLVNSENELVGNWEFYDSNGILFLSARYEAGKPVDTLNFFKDHQLALQIFEMSDNRIYFKSIINSVGFYRTFENGKSVYRKADGEIQKNALDILKPFLEFDVQFPGGKDALTAFQKEHLEYPESLAKRKVEGEVVVSFKVNKSGLISGVEIISSTHKKFEKEALNLFAKMPRWQPGLQRGHPIISRNKMTIYFRL